MTAQEAYDIVISPMLATYPAPTHLRDDPEAQRKTLELYLRALERFDGKTLAQAWQKVTADHTYWVWPVPGQIVEACRLFAPRRVESEDEKRRQQAQEMSDAYTSRYMKTSKLARLARDEGWAGHLRYYVAAASWVQSQILCKIENLSWESTLLAPGRFRSSEEAFAGYRQRIEGPISRGEILVRVPTGLISDWKAHAKTARESAPPSGHEDRLNRPTERSGRAG